MRIKETVGVLPMIFIIKVTTNKEEKAIDMFLKMLGDISKKVTVYSIDQKYQIP